MAKAKPDSKSRRTPALQGAENSENECVAMSRAFKRWIVEQSLASNVGHIGSALSIADIVATLWGGVLRNPGTDLPDRDRFILGKGHAALALYCALRWKKIIDEAAFKTYARDGTLLGVHPEHALKGVDLSTGSLGQALSVACGVALGLRTKKFPSRVFILMSDAECNEGQVWEAAMFAGQHKLSNLTAIVDLNGLQALGFTKEIIDLHGQTPLWKSCNWDVVETDGHDIAKLLKTFNAEPGSKPRVILARTVLGKGVSFMENRLEWHYRNLSPELAAKALAELESAR